MNLGPGLHGPGQIEKVLGCLQGFRVGFNEKLRAEISLQNILNMFTFYSGTLFENAVIQPPLDLEKDRAVFIVKTKTQFEAVLGSVNGSPVEPQVIGIQIKTMDDVGVVGFTHGELVELKITAHIRPNTFCYSFSNKVFQLKALLLHFIFSHIVFSFRSKF